MSVSDIVASTSRVHPEVAVVRLRGELGPASGEALVEAVRAAGRETGAKSLVLDFSAVERLSGAVLIPLAVAQAGAEREGLRLGVTGLPPEAVEAFRVVWPPTALPVCADEAEAVALMSPSAADRGGAATGIAAAGWVASAGKHGGWAQSFGRLHVTAEADVPRINVEGQTTCGPAEGFGRMWHKTYRVRLEGSEATPEDVISGWRERFGQFWPPGNRMDTGPEGLVPGAVGVITLGGPLGLRLITGVQVVYSGPESFVFIPVRGHMFCGLIAFSAIREEGTTVAQVEVAVRASDPLWEVVMRTGGYRQEDRHWLHTLKVLSEHFGVRAWPEVSAAVVDPALHWRHAGNLLFNSGIWSGLYLAATALRRARRSA
ncbi:MAG: STAS domain-containing protein [Anaerolineae bacterium]|nr:STAS domain-containing protein [Anaerolineae bacterium]